MKTYNLSPFRKTTPDEPGISFALPDTPGAWIEIPGNLGELGDALDPGAKANVDAVRATPDPWAQLRTFADALLHPHPLHAAIVGQWRGLLALLAFADISNDVYRLEFATVDLAASGSRFAGVMSKLLPRSALPIDVQWSRPVVVRLSVAGDPIQRRPIAVLNPLSLIAAGRDVEKLALPSIPWMKTGLGDPTALRGGEALSFDELRMLYTYVRTLEADLGRLVADPEDATFGLLRAALQAYARDCVDPARHPGIEAHEVKVLSADAFGEGLPQAYRILRRPVSVAPPAPGTSHCRIDLRGDLGEVPPFKGLILLDAAIADTLGRTANRIILWGGTTLKTALESRETVAALRREIAAAGYLLVEPRDFFSDTMVRLNIPRQDGHIEAHPPGFVDALLPLTPLVLLIAGPDALRMGVAMDNDGYATLGVRLSGSAQIHRIRRKFAAEPTGNQGRLLEEMAWGLGDVAIWPNFRTEKWRRYFARLTFPIQNHHRLRGRIATSGAALATMLSNGRAPATAHDPLPALRRAEAFAVWYSSLPFDGQQDPLPPFAGRSDLAPWLDRLRGKEADNVVVEIQSSQMPFEAMFFSIIPEPGLAPVPAGLAIVRLPAVKAANDGGVVAVDFGTTNTVACIGSARPVQLAQRIHHPIWSKSANFIAIAEDIMEKSFQDFMPPESRLLPTPSVVIKRDLDTAGRAAIEQPPVDDAMLFHHLIYFQPSPGAQQAVRSLNLGDWTQLLKRTVFNLKWSHDPQVMKAAKRYLRQLVLMLAAEAVAAEYDPTRLRWRFSRPESMMGSEDFETALRLLIVDALPGTRPEQIEDLRSEGLAAAAYILTTTAGREFNRLDLNVILDIGGGTTDIALWDKGVPEPRLIWSGSLRVAGLDFFTRHIIANPAILTSLHLAPWAAVLKPDPGVGVVPIDGDKIGYVGELLFSGDTLNRAFDKSWHEVHFTPEGERLQQTASVFLGGVAWYIGRTVRQLIDEGRLDARVLDRIAVALCGRGAGLFARIQGDKPNRSTRVSRLLGLIASAADHVCEPWVFVSPHPKIEVAAGMIEHPDALTAAPVRPAAVYAANDASAPRRVAEGEPSTSQHATPSPIGRAEELGIAEITAFLDAFPAFSGFSVTLGPRQLDRLPVAVADAARRDIEDGLRPQPPFVAALKELVAMMVDPGELRPAIAPVRA